MNRKYYNNLECLLDVEGKSKGTYREYFANIGYMEKYFNKKDFKKITLEELKEYVDYLDKEYSKTTYNNHVAAIRYFFKKSIKEKKYVRSIKFKKGKR